MMRSETLANKRNWQRDRLRINKDNIIIFIMGLFLSHTNILNKLTPFGVGFLAAYIIIKGTNFPLLLAVVTGTVVYHGLGGWGYLLGCIVIYGFFKFVRKVRSFSLLKATFLSSTIFLSCRMLGLLLGKDLFLYDIFIAIFESVVVFTMTYIFSFSYPIDGIKGGNFSNEKLVCSFVVLALALAGISNLSIFNINIKNLVSIVLILSFSFNQGALMGATTGIILGMIAYISDPQMPFVIGIFGIAGLLAGIFKDLGKSGSCLGFLLGNGIVSFYINGFGTSFLNIRELILGVLFFLLIGSKINVSMTKLFASNVKKDYIEKRDELVIKKLDRMAELFDNLSETFRESSKEREVHSTGEVYAMVDGIANQLCKHCYKYERCWKGNYFNTYQNFFNLVGLVEMKSVEDSSVYSEAKKFCIRFGDVVQAVDRAVDKMKLNERWKLKLKENRLLLSEQLEGVGNIIQNIATDIYTNTMFNEEIEENLYKELKNNRVDVREVSVTQIGKEDFEIFIDLNSNMDDSSRLKFLISKVLDFPVVIDGNFRENGKTHRFKLIRHNRFSAMTKVANLPNSENRVSGDSFTFGEVENTHYSAISDGMGIGRKASEESKVAISLLERLMEANVDKDLTLRTINSVLRAKSNEEMFATLDLAFIDLYSGKLQMIKTGAPVTFIKRKDRVDVINGSTLPVGLLRDVDFNLYEEYIEDGDIVIMMSDGVLDANRDLESSEEWMREVIMSITSPNPQTIARGILEEAKRTATNSRDDMTVLATKVWKNI